MRLRCAEPGCSASFVWDRRPGRRPTRCEAHRAKNPPGRKGRPQDRKRDLARRQARAEERARAQASPRNPDDAVRLAISLSLHPEDKAAAGTYAGVAPDGEALDDALRLYKGLSDPNDMSAALSFLRAAAINCAHVALRQAHLLSPAQAASSAQSLARAYDVLRGDGATVQYTDVRIEIPEGYRDEPPPSLAH